jgi:DNA-binding HxlR family transcriptional regulator
MKKSAECPKIKGKLARSICPITNTLDVVGDKWSLLVIRDMLFLKKKTFNEFLESPEKIATNILTDRLKRLEEHAIIKKQPQGKSSARHEYVLTPRGKSLRPFLLDLIRWGNTHIEGTKS